MRCPEQLVLKMPCVNRRDKISLSLSWVGRYVTGVLFNDYMVVLRCVEKCLCTFLFSLPFSPNSVD